MGLDLQFHSEVGVFEVVGVEVFLEVFFDEERPYFLLSVIVPDFYAIDGDFWVQDERSVVVEQISRGCDLNEFKA